MTSVSKLKHSEEHFRRHTLPYLPICNQILWLLAFWLWGNFCGLIYPATWVLNAKYFMAAHHWYFSIYRLICSTGRLCFFSLKIFSSIIIHKWTHAILFGAPCCYCFISFFVLCSKTGGVRSIYIYCLQLFGPLQSGPCPRDSTRTALPEFTNDLSIHKIVRSFSLSPVSPAVCVLVDHSLLLFWLH